MRERGEVAAAVVIQGNEGYGVRHVLLNQWQHALTVGIRFEYVALQKGDCVRALRAVGAPVTVIGGGIPVALPRNRLLLPLVWLRWAGRMKQVVRGVRAELQARRPDIVYAHTHYTHVLSALAARGLPTRSVAQMHNVLNRRRLAGLQRILVSLIHWVADDLLLVISNTAYASLWGPVRRKARRVYNGVEVDAIRAQVAGVRRMNDRVVCIGRIVDWKRQDVAIQAIAKLRDAGVDCTLELIGGPLTDENAYYARLRALVERLGLQDRVIFAGAVQPPYERMAAAAVSISCSEQEPFGLVVVESAAAGAAVIVADTGATAEIVLHEQTGLTYRAGDAGALADGLGRLLADAALRRTLARAALERAREHFDVSVQMRNLRRCFDEVLRLSSPATKHEGRAKAAAARTQPIEERT